LHSLALESQHPPASLLGLQKDASNKILAGIPDFRGPEGAWTLRAQGREGTGKTISTLQAIPTPTHIALAALQERGILKYLISQNCDGLHRKSGIPSVSTHPNFGIKSHQLLTISITGKDI
jgi:NAD-dependent SIR2 family protein deacetylase